MNFDLALEAIAHVPRPLSAELIVFRLRPHRHDQAVEVQATIGKASGIVFYDFARVVELPGHDTRAGIIAFRVELLILFEHIHEEFLTDG